MCGATKTRRTPDFRPGGVPDPVQIDAVLGRGEILMVRALQGSAASLLGVVIFVVAAGASGDSPLSKAVKAGDTQAVRALIKSGADVNARTGDGSTPLLWAAHHSHDDVAS